jgi:hypothetical protein
MKPYTHIFAFGIGVIITIAYFESCTETPKPITNTEYRDTTIFIHDTVFKGEGKGVLKYTYSGMIHDTIIRNDSVFITLRDSVSFTAKLDTIQNADTLNLEFNYPSAMFSYRLRRAPIEVKYTNTVTTNTVTVKPSRFGFGVQVGVGYVQPIVGAGGLGAYGGVGGYYNF